MRNSTRGMRRASLALGIGWLLFAACRESGRGVERLVVRPGETFREVTDTLAAHGVVRWRRLFRGYGRLRGAQLHIKPGTYDVPRGASWPAVLHALVGAHVASGTITVPEGWTIRQIAERIGPISGVSADSAKRRLLEPALADSLGAPGPTLEGYLFPATYEFPAGRSLEELAATMLERYRHSWTPARRARLDSLGLTERQIVALASVIQAEARWTEEMPLISAVFHNRLLQNMPLQADPTVRYALSPGTQLRYTQIDSLTQHPYNTYTHAGLPPGTIGSPGEAALDAALHPAPKPFLYFVARRDGHHEFSRTFEEHRRMIERIRGRDTSR